MHVQEMYRRLTGLVVFRRLLQDPVVAACGEMLSARVRGTAAISPPPAPDLKPPLPVQ
ncbi:MAG: hypothetical protein ACLTYN_07240 [Dysosmobacter welbionis]